MSTITVDGESDFLRYTRFRVGDKIIAKGLPLSIVVGVHFGWSAVLYIYRFATPANDLPPYMWYRANEEDVDTFDIRCVSRDLPLAMKLRVKAERDGVELK